jgi:hypothetical protein
MRKLLRGVAFAVIATVAAAEVRAERAATIDYDFIERPANLPNGFVASAGTTLRFLAIKAIDGFRVDAALWQPPDKSVAATTLIVPEYTPGAPTPASQDRCARLDRRPLLSSG